MRGLLGWTKARVRDRENLRFERTRLFGRARRLFVAIGNQLHARGAIDEPRDVFFLTVAEVLGAIEGFAVSADLAGARRAAQGRDGGGRATSRSAGADHRHGRGGRRAAFERATRHGPTAATRACGLRPAAAPERFWRAPAWCATRATRV